MDSYSAGSSSGSNRDRVQTQQVGPYVVFTVKTLPSGLARCFSLRSAKDDACTLFPSSPSQAPDLAPRLQRVSLASLVPIHEGHGWMSFWDPSIGSCVARFRAIEDEYCQGMLCGDRYICFNPLWSDDLEAEVDARQTVRMYDVSSEGLSDNLGTPARICWNATLPAHVVDLASNGSIVACAYARLTENDTPTLPDAGEFGVELRCAETGEFLRTIGELAGVDDVIFLDITRFHCLVVRASDAGQLVTVVDLQSARIVYEVDLKLSFTRTFGGIHISDDETFMLLWSSSNHLAVIDLLRGTWTLHAHVEVDEEMLESWPYGVWFCREHPDAGFEERRYTVGWKAIGGLPPASARMFAVM